METRKRSASQRVSTIVETKSKPQGSSQKPAKLILKVPPPSSPNTSPSPSRKKAKKSSTLEDCVHLETSEDLLEHLLTISDSDLPSLEDNVLNSIRILRDLWQSHIESVAVCSVLVRLVSSLVVRSETPPQYVQYFVLSLADHEDTGVKTQALKHFQRITQHFSRQLTFCQTVRQVALKEIHSIHHTVRVECLKLIGRLGHVTTGDPESPLAVLEEYCSDGDPRVRTAAFEELFLAQQQRGQKISLSVYYKASDALSDDSEDVRVAAVRLVWALGIQHGEKVVPLKQDPSLEIRLTDDAFVKICDMINDISMRVRALAAQLLGDFHRAGTKFLEQTLDKKLMSHLRVVKSEHERQRELHAAGGGGGGAGGGAGGSRDWDSGKTWGSSVPKMELDPSEMSLMSAGSCGAFVHGLEDEFMEVRLAAVESVCRLGVHCRQFASQSLDFLVDMFNDEIQAVRLQAINALRQVSANIELRQDQLETILAALEESCTEIREALHSLLSTCRITTSRGLNSTIHGLLDNLRKYPSDTQSVWNCLQHLGCNHGSLVSTLVPELLSTHPFFMGKEPDVDDPAYICILILVFNAVTQCSTITPQFPSHVFRHYTYLRDTLPDLIPWIKIGMPTVMKLGPVSRKAGHSRAKSFLQQLLSRAQCAATGREAQHVWQTCISDLRRVSQLNPQISAIAQFSATYLQCQLLMNKVSEILSQDIFLSSEGPGHHGLPHTIGNIREMLLLSYRLEHTFTNLSPELVQKVRLIRVSAHAMLLLLVVQLDYDTEQGEEFSRMKQYFLQRLTELKKFSDSAHLPLPPTLSPLIEMNMATTAVEILTQSLQPLVRANFCTPVSLSDLLGVQQCKAEILEPQDSSKDDFTKFVASLALSLPIKASLYNMADSGRVAIQVKFPDGRRILVSPKTSDVRQVGTDEEKMESDVIISHGVWTEPSQVEVCVVLRYPPDLREECCFPASTALRKPTTSSNSSQSHTTSLQLQSHGTLTQANTVHSNHEDSFGADGLREKSVLVISDVVRINVHPQENTIKSFNVF